MTSSAPTPADPPAPPGPDGAPLADRTVGWRIETAPVGYEAAVRFMQERAVAIRSGEARELIWLVEHTPLITAGTSARDEDLLQPGRFPVHATGRGGEHTYHGPGQRVAYAMLDVQRRLRGDVRAFVALLESVVIEALAALGVCGETRAGRPGVWVALPMALGGGEAKIAALGVRISRGVSLHGVAVNVAPELEHFRAIVPCGITDAGVTSLAALGVEGGMRELDAALRAAFVSRLGAMRVVGPVCGAEPAAGAKQARSAD